MTINYINLLTELMIPILIGIIYISWILHRKGIANRKIKKSIIEEETYYIIAEPKYSHLRYWIFESGISKIEAEDKAYCLNIKYRDDPAIVPSNYHLKAYKISHYKYFKKANPDKCHLN